MKPLDADTLKAVTEEHQIQYDAIESASPNSIATKMSRIYKMPRARLFEKIANLGDHTRLFSHLTAINVIKNSDVANVIGDNQFVIVEGLAEGGSKLGVKLVTVTANEKIQCELMTDPFPTAVTGRPSDPKRGMIEWTFEEIDENTTRMTASSDFQVENNSAYVRGAIDHVWLDFFENVMVDTEELLPTAKRAAPFGTRQLRRPPEESLQLEALRRENEELKGIVANLSLEVHQLRNKQARS